MSLFFIIKLISSLMLHHLECKITISQTDSWITSNINLFEQFCLVWGLRDTVFEMKVLLLPRGQKQSKYKSGSTGASSSSKAVMFNGT